MKSEKSQDKNRQGKFGEHAVIAKILSQEINVDICVPVFANQKGVDLVVHQDSFLRVQVKTTELNNDSTNNAQKVDLSSFDILIIVECRGNDDPCLYILNQRDIDALRSEIENNKRGRKRKIVSLDNNQVECCKLPLSRMANGSKQFYTTIENCRDAWHKLLV